MQEYYLGFCKRDWLCSYKRNCNIITITVAKIIVKSGYLGIKDFSNCNIVTIRSPLTLDFQDNLSHERSYI